MGNIVAKGCAVCAIFGLTFVLITSCAAPPPVDGSSTVHFTGSIHRADGTPAPGAFAVFAPDGEETPIITNNPNGTFAADVPTDILLRLSCAAPDHVESHLPVFLRGRDGNAQIDITLSPNPWRDDIEKILLYGNWGAMESTFEAPLERQNDGQWLLEIPAEGTSLVYELYGITTNDHLVNGQISDHFKYDGNGDFLSIVDVAGETVTIVYDPSLAPKFDAEGLPKAKWDRNHPALDDFAQIGFMADTFESNFRLAFAEFRENHSFGEPYSNEGPPIAPDLLGLMKPGNPPDVRAFAAAQWLKYNDSTKPTEVTLTELLDALPPSSSFWALSIDRPWLPAFDTTPGERMALMRRFIDENDNPEVQTSAMIGQAWIARDSGDQRRFDTLMGELAVVANGDKKAQRAIQMMRPEGRLAIGQPVPDFDVTLLDGTSLTQEDLKGTFTLIDFWSTRCGPCIGEMSQLHDAWDRYHQRGLEILSFSLDNSDDAIVEFRRGKWTMPWKNARPEGGHGGPIASAFEVWGIPTVFLIAPDGTIAATSIDLRGERLLKNLDRILPPSAG